MMGRDRDMAFLSYPNPRVAWCGSEFVQSHL